MVGAYGLYAASFPIFLIGSLLTGIYMSAQGFYRFAAADTATDAFRPKAISYVMAGGLVSAVIGPQIVKWTADAYVIPFLGTYVAAIGVNVLGSLLFLFIDIPKPPVPTQDAPRGRSRMELIRTPRIAVAVICATVSYALMNLVMTSTPLAVVGCGLSGDLLGASATAGMSETERLKSFLDLASNVVTGHVLAMFAPSFFTGHLIARFGVERIMGLGILILGAAGVVALQGVALENFYVALILLGLGWNFGFIGATTMLAGAHAPHERGRMQGLNDLIVFGGVTMASLASGGLMNCSGGSAVEGWAAVNWAMIPFLVLAGGSLMWLVFSRKARQAA
jgi:MFS family permease